MNTSMLAIEHGRISRFDDVPPVEGWTLHRTVALPHGVNAATRWSDRTIWLDEALSGPFARFVLEHELQHVRRGPRARDVPEDAEERACDEGAARAMWAAGLVVDVAWLCEGARP